jgi:multidrug resistance efflux pump
MSDAAPDVGSLKSEGLTALRRVRSPRMAARIAKVLAFLFVIIPVAVLFVPWQQNIPAVGNVTAFDPLDRPQRIDAPVTGRIAAVYVQDNTTVSAGDTLIEIEDLDPDLLRRLEQERQAIEAKIAAREDKASAYQTQIENLTATRDLAVTAAEHRLAVAVDDLRGARERRVGAEAALEAAQLQYERKKRLLDDGVVSQRDLEVAERDFEIAQTLVNAAEAAISASDNDRQAIQTEISRIRADAEAKVDSARAAQNDALASAEDGRASLAKLEVQIARQQSQRVIAPRTGTVFRLAAAQGGEVIKAGDPLLTLVPDAKQLAVELWVSGNDAPLIEQGRHARIQFEGWPAVQFAGWPSVAVGTFGGTVALVDPTDNGEGQFRILVLPDRADDPWPADRFLRQGVRAQAWVLLNRVSLGYEWWRQLNGFPPVVSPEEPESDIARKRLK